MREEKGLKIISKYAHTPTIIKITPISHFHLKTHFFRSVTFITEINILKNYKFVPTILSDNVMSNQIYQCFIILDSIFH